MFPLPPLYAIVDVDVCDGAGLAPIGVARAYLTAGVRVVQVRAKHHGSAKLLELVEAFRCLADPIGATVVTNDRVDVARTAGTGVHLGQDDLPADAARHILGPTAVIGLSTHTADQLLAATRLPVDYLAFGPIFPTSSKESPHAVVGLERLAAAAAVARTAGLPLVAIGGITLARARAVRTAGADSVAVIRDLMSGTDGPEKRARRFLAAVGDQPV